MASMASFETEGMLTAYDTTPPVSPATICSATMTPARSCPSVVEAPRCGVMITLSNLARGKSSGTGSDENTSRPAEATLPDSSARTRAASSTIPPRALLMMRTPFFIFSKAASPMRPMVSGVLGRWTLMKSEAA